MQNKVFNIIGMIVFSLVMIVVSREYAIWRLKKEKQYGNQM
jgi:hypothetical protein